MRLYAAELYAACECLVIVVCGFLASALAGSVALVVHVRVVWFVFPTVQTCQSWLPDTLLKWTPFAF
jgi:uncharacterized membrane protein